MKCDIKVGSTSQRRMIFIQDSSSTVGAGLSGLTNASSGLAASYSRDDDGNAGATTISLASATLGTFTSGGFKEKDSTKQPGVYEIGIPNAALTSGSSYVLIYLKGATNMAPLVLEIQLVAYDPYDSVRLGLTSLPNAAAEASGGLYTRGSGAGQINQPSNGRIDTNAISMSGTTLTARDIGTSVLLSSGTGTGQLSLSSGTVTVGTNNDKTGYGISATAVQAIWDALTSALTTANSIGKLLVDNINATISSRLASASYTAPDNTSISAIKTTTDKFVFTVANKVDSTIQLASDFAQGAADKVWSSASRTLSAFSFAVDISSAGALTVWAALTSALTTAGSIGKKLADWVLGSDNKVLLSNNAQTGVTIPTVTDVTKITAANTELTSVPLSTASLLDMWKWLFIESRNKITQTSTNQIVLADNDTTPVGTASVSDDGTTFTRGKFS